MSKTFYITTPIYYVNDVPHIGHAYTTIAADVAARYHRMAGDDVFFLTGTDEHGINILRVAERNNTSPREWTDRIAGEFRQLWDFLNVSYDDFIRTTEPRHTKVVQEIFRRLYEKGDIYLGTYDGWYCPSCESFYPEGDLGPNRTCPIHTPRHVEWTEEESYLFRLSAYNEWLLTHIEANPSAVEPEARRNEVLSLLRSGLKDIAVSRTTFAWGVPVPFDPKHVVYVWIDALTNYISAIGYLDDPAKFSRYWPANVHLMGKEIIRFHAVIWPIILHAAGIAVPRQTFAHGHLTFGGQRFSKSLGIILDPRALSREIAAESGADVDVCVDALRYFLLREVPFGGDGDFSRAQLVSRFNADLANDYGNLLNRTLPLVERYFGGVLLEPGPEEGGDGSLRQRAEALPGTVLENVQRYDFQRALSAIWQLLGAANRYLDQEAPWNLYKEGKSGRAGTVLVNTLEALRVANVLLEPVLPSATLKVWAQLGHPEFEERARQVRASGQAWRGTGLTIGDARRWRWLRPGTRVRPGAPIFPRVDTKAAAVTDQPEEAQMSGAISIEEFRKLDLRVAKVLEARRVPSTDTLIEAKVDIGGEVRTIVTGLIPHYTPEDLVGKTIVVLANLLPRKVRGVESRGMLLAAEADGTLGLVVLDRDMPAGARVS